MKFLIVAVALTCSTMMLAQTDNTNALDLNAPSSTIEPGTLVQPSLMPSLPAPGDTAVESRATVTSNLVVAATPIAPQTKTLDKKFFLLSGFAAGLTVMDAELTARCTARQTCQEGNPMFGANPTRARLYGISIPVLGGEMLLSRWLKQRHPTRNVWMAPFIATSAVHAIGATSSAGK